MGIELQSAILTDSKEMSKSSLGKRDPTSLFNEVLVNRIAGGRKGRE